MINNSELCLGKCSFWTYVSMSTTPYLFSTLFILTLYFVLCM